MNAHNRNCVVFVCIAVVLAAEVAGGTLIFKKLKTRVEAAPAAAQFSFADRLKQVLHAMANVQRPAPDAPVGQNAEAPGGGSSSAQTPAQTKTQKRVTVPILKLGKYAPGGGEYEYPELSAIFKYIDDNYGTAELLKQKFGKPKKITRTKPAELGEDLVRADTYYYDGFTASFIINARLNKSWGLDEFIVTGNSDILFNGVHLGSDKSYVAAVAGRPKSRNYLRRKSNSVTLSVDDSYIRFKLKSGKVVEMDHYGAIAQDY